MLRPDERRSERLALRRIIGRVAGFDDRFRRLAECGYKRCTERPGIRLGADRKAHMVGLVTCSSIHCCPMCSASIRQERAEKFSADAARWERSGGTTLLVTLTFPHGVSDSLADTYDLVAKGWSWITGHRSWKALRASLGRLAWCRTVEVTHGSAGWHPHIHAVLMFSTDDAARACAEVAAVVRPLWNTFVTRRGFREPHPVRGVDVEICHSAARAGEYICKSQSGSDIGREVFRGDVKSGRDGSRTFLQIAADFGRTGLAADRDLMRDYMAATFDRRAFTYSRGYAEVIGSVVVVQSDDAESDDAVAGKAEQAAVAPVTVAILHGWMWDRIRDIDGLVAQLLDAAEQTGRPGVDRVLVAHGFPASIDPRQESP